jgi:hypothetical protein
MATQTSSALWLALAGGRHRVAAVIFKAKVVGGQSLLSRVTCMRDTRALLQDTAPTLTRSIGFCVIWVCISSSSSSRPVFGSAQYASQRSEKDCMSAKLLRASLGMGIGRLHTAIVARNDACSLSQ